MIEEVFGIIEPSFGIIEEVFGVIEGNFLVSSHVLLLTEVLQWQQYHPKTTFPK